MIPAPLVGVTTAPGFPPFHLHPDVFVVTAALALSYWWALAVLGPRVLPAGQRVATRNNILCYSIGLFLLWVFAEWPIHDLAEHYLFSVHMVQHLVFTTVSAPLMLMGLPPWLMHKLLVQPKKVHAIAKQVTRPVVALVIFNSFLVLTHWPTVVNETTHNEPFHFGVHTVMFGTALILWMPMINQLPELPRLSYPQRMLYVFLQSFVPTIPASFLTLSTGVVYKAYAGRPELLGFSTISDQQVAGAIMKLGGGAILWGIMGYTFFKWVAEEQRRDRVEREAERAAKAAGANGSAPAEAHPAGEGLPATLTWDDVARELERVPPPPE
jgi:putative membrane protein